MTKHFFKGLKAFNRGLLIGLEIVTVLMLILVGFLGYALYELSRGPVDLSFMRERIERSFSGSGDVKIQMKKAQAVWPGLSGPLLLELEGLQVQQNGQLLVEIKDLAVTLAKAPLLVGRIRPERVIIRRPTLMLERTADNRLTFALTGPLQSADPTASSADMTKMLAGMLFGGGARGNNLFSRVSEVEIRQGRVRVADQAMGMTWQLNDVTLFLQEVDVGVYGSFALQLPGEQHFSLVLTYNREQDVLSVNSRFKDFGLPGVVGRVLGWDWLRRQRLPLSGAFVLEAGVREPVVDKLSLQASADAGSLDLIREFPETLPVDDVFMDLQFDRAQARWDAPSISFSVRDIPVRLTGGMEQRADGDYAGVATLNVPSVKIDDIEHFWPAAMKDTPLEKWLVRNLSLGTVKDIKVDIPLKTRSEAGRLLLLAMQPKATFAFENLKVDYRAPLYPVEAGVGTGTFETDTLSIKIDSGKMADLAIKGGAVVIDDITKKGKGVAHITTHFTGPLPSVLSYIALEPIRLGGRLPIPVDTVKGQGDYTVNVTFPTLRDLPADLVTAEVDATLTGLSLPKLVKGQTLAGGPYTLKVKEGLINLGGVGTLGGRPVSLEWMQPVNPDGKQALMQVTAKVDTDAALRRAFGADLDVVEGAVPITATYTEKPGGVETLDLAADLTPAKLNIGGIGYEKAAGVAGNASLFVTIRNKVPEKAEKVTIKAPKLSAENGTLKFGKIDGEFNVTRASFPALRFGQGSMAVTYDRKPDFASVTVKGKKIDLSSFLSGPSSTKEPGPRMYVQVNAEEALMGGLESLRNVAFDATIGTSRDIDRLQFSGAAGGKPFGLDYVPNKDGKMTLNLNSADAGAFLRGLNIYDNMVGGTLRVTGSPIGDNKRDVKGEMAISKFRIVKAPVLAKLLNSLSVQGLEEQLGDKGMKFDRLSSGFAWLKRPNIDVMTFRDGRTSGSSLGLTFDGQIDRTKGRIEVTGTIIPLSGLNKLAGKIPLIGQIISGGGALFAATYSIKGPIAKPKTMINPLSVLTPGILRKIFFERSPADPLKPSRSTPPKASSLNN